MHFDKTDLACLYIFVLGSLLYTINKTYKLSHPTKSTEETTDSLSEKNKLSDYAGKIDSSGVINGFAYVDLGLPDGLKWAVCDVGASKAGEYGNLFRWSDTIPYTKYSGKYVYKKIYYHTRRNYHGIDAYSNRLNYYDDAATQHMGNSWRMPTKEEMDELINSCDWEYYDKWRIVGTSQYNQQKIIFLLRDIEDVNGKTSIQWGSYWTASNYNDNGYYACSMIIRERPQIDYNQKECAMQIRAVSEFNPTSNGD